MNLMLNQLFKLAYKILGAEKSSLLATGAFGNLFLKVRYGNIDKPQMFSSNEGINLLLTPKEASLLGLIYFGSINPLETDLLKRKLKKSDIFFDIGAYIDGWHSLLASKLVGDKGKVYTFEPHPGFYARLRKNIKLNNIKNIKLEKLAISNKNGLRNFFPANNVSSFFEEHAKVVNSRSKPFKVKATKLDDYVRKNKIFKIDLVKIDVECAEMLVLEGARKALAKKNAPDLLIEVADHYLKTAGASEAELVTFLTKLGYKAYLIDFSGLKSYKEVDLNQRSLNLYFSKK